jgi:hypothetical protein
MPGALDHAPGTASGRAAVLLCLLAACGTPQERCVARETRDLRAVDRRIAETEGNLARGYALQDYEVDVTVLGRCLVRDPPPAEGQPAPPPRYEPCWRERTVTETRRVRIDPARERERLAGLQAERAVLARSAAAAVRLCRETFPE